MRKARPAEAAANDRSGMIRKLRIVATEVLGSDLEPGDLFSTMGQVYFNTCPRSAIGEKVYIRTETPCSKHEGETKIFRITIQKENNEQPKTNNA